MPIREILPKRRMLILSESICINVSASEAGVRIDKLLSEKIDGITRSHIQKLIEGENITVSGLSVKSNYKVRAEDEIIVTIPEADETEIIPEDIPINVVYEDDDMLVVDKPQGMVVHPAVGNYTGTLVNATGDFA